MKKKVESFAKGILARIVARIFYIAGLTLLFPFIYLRNSGEKGQAVLTIALSLISIGALIIFARTKRWSKTFSSLGLMTLIPGLIAVFFSIYSKEIIFSYANKTVVNFETFKPFLVKYINSSVPKFWGLTIFYIITGVILLYFGNKLKKLRHRL